MPRFPIVMSVASLMLLLAVLDAQAEGSKLAVSNEAWELRGDARVGEHLGKPALMMRMGEALRGDVEFVDGTIELDVAVSPHRAFVYVKFRIQGDGENEEIYLRSHKSELPDAIQYTPIWQRRSNWQLYHGHGYTAAAPFAPNTWMPVKLVVQGQRAAVFVGDMTTPRMIIPLARKAASGAVAVRGFLPRGSAPDDVSTANFANLVVRPGFVDFDFPPLETAVAEGVVTSWQVSPPFLSSTEEQHEEIPEALAGVSWQSLKTDPSGLLIFDRHVTRPEGSRWSAIAARLVIEAEAEELRRFDFGYSDRVSVFLNGRLIAAGNATYSFDRPRRQGLIGFDQGRLYLPLDKGRNELVLIISDVFGGWAVMGKLSEF